MREGFMAGLKFSGGAILLSCVASSMGAVSYSTTGSTYSQNFDTLSPTGTTNVWTNNTTIPGFYAFNSGTSASSVSRIAGGIDDIAPANWNTVVDYRSTGGSSSRLYAFGHATLTPTDRALGSIAGAVTGSDAGDILYALVLQNTTGEALTSFTLSYTGEQWLDQAANTGPVAVGPQTLKFSYLVKSTFSAIDDIPTQNGLGGYTAVTDLDFTSPNTGNTTASAVALNGNLTANRTARSATVNANWGVNEFLVLRFWDDEENGNDQTHGIDDLSFSAAVPEPTGLGLAMIVAGALTSRRRRQS